MFYTNNYLTSNLHKPWNILFLWYYSFLCVTVLEQQSRRNFKTVILSSSCLDFLIFHIISVMNACLGLSGKKQHIENHFNGYLLIFF